MGYYDDWVDPNGTFRSKPMTKRSKRKRSSRPRKRSRTKKERTRYWCETCQQKTVGVAKEGSIWCPSCNDPLTEVVF